MAAVVKHYGRRLEQVETPAEAFALYHDAKHLPSSSTKTHVFEQCGLCVNGPLFPDAAKSHLVIALDVQSGQPRVIKFLDQGSGAASGEAEATRILCTNMPVEMPLVPGQLRSLTLSQEHSGLGHLPGTHTVLVMPAYFGTLDPALYMSDEVLAREMRRMVQALDWVHSKGYVHMDVKVSQAT